MCTSSGQSGGTGTTLGLNPNRTGGPWSRGQHDHGRRGSPARPARDRCRFGVGRNARQVSASDNRHVALFSAAGGGRTDGRPAAGIAALGVAGCRCAATAGIPNWSATVSPNWARVAKRTTSAPAQAVRAAGRAASSAGPTSAPIRDGSSNGLRVLSIRWPCGLLSASRGLPPSSAKSTPAPVTIAANSAWVATTTV